MYVTQIEGMAAVGLVKRYWIEDCNVPGMKRVVVEDETGTQYETKCIDSRAVKRVVLYLGDASKYSKDVVVNIDVLEKDEIFDEAN
jgi:hypothetical protein